MPACFHLEGHFPGARNINADPASPARILWQELYLRYEAPDLLECCALAGWCNLDVCALQRHLRCEYVISQLEMGRRAEVEEHGT